jgi:hypothetical protein
MQSIGTTRLHAGRERSGHYRQHRRRRMRRDDQCGGAVEADQTERAKAVVNADGGIGYVFVPGGERMEMGNANRLRQKQYRRGYTRDPVHPASAICKCRLHQIIRV